MTISLDRPTPLSVVAPAPAVRWLAVLALALGGFAIGTTEFVAMGLLPDIASTLGVTEPTAGHVISAYAMGVVIGAPVIAALAARVPRKALLLSLMAVFTLGNLASVLAPSYPTLMTARFVAGLPHGAYFGVAALAATHLMGRQNRAKAVAHVMCGLTIATVIGVPLASWLGQVLGWRSAFGLVVIIGVVTLTALWFWLPVQLRTMHVTSPLTELGALKRVQVWFALAVGMIGFGGMFAVYTYISTTMTDVAGFPRALVPLALMVFGLGMVVGNLIGGRLADGSVIRALYLSMTALGAILALFVVASHNPWTALPVLFGIGAAGSAVAPALQTRLMDVALDAQTLAAALNHSALNIGNATGAWIGGLVIAAGFGYTAPAAAGALLAAAGIAVLTVSVALQRRQLA
ncbi:MFS transporter [Mycobacterium sp. ACS1612]|uniref:MFS transporter n=1 Tax=Mycobacterium sp. ACS1612 TaxID=1834117 RepID=UPI0007FDDF15|nr:MFS transporter [Mycobacterium sp. ACS1612]OBF27716.1 MFS transporter [Mycobacterium sp. ACS1612]